MWKKPNEHRRPGAPPGAFLLAGSFRTRDGRGLPQAARRPDLRLKAHEIREKAIANLDVLLETLTAKIRRNGGHVFFAATAKDAVGYCIEVARRNQVRLVVKGKSMVTRKSA